MYPRFIVPSLEAALADTPVVVVNGPRQSGKTTLVSALVRDAAARRYVTLDDLVVLAAAREDPVAFVSSLDGPISIDEIQRAPDLFLPIKAAVDRDRTPGRFLLTGSADVLALPRLADSLAGRMEILSLWPLAAAEIERTAAPPCARVRDAHALFAHSRQGALARAFPSVPLSCASVSCPVPLSRTLRSDRRLLASQDLHRGDAKGTAGRRETCLECSAARRSPSGCRSRNRHRKVNCPWFSLL